MEPSISIYSFSLYTALPLMLFFGFYFLFAKTPEKKIFKNYLRSRQIMGIAMLLLSANYSVHFFFGIRFKNADSAILMNMSTYFLCYSLFSSALIMLLDRFYITKRRVWTHIILWIIFSTLSGVVLFLLPSGIMQKFSLFALAVWLVVFGVVLARRVIIAYRRAIRIFNETQADDIGTYIEWLSIFTYWAVIFGVGCGLLTFLPDKYVFIWILSSIPFYSYLFYSYQNYLLFYEQVENAFEQDIQSEEELLTDTETEPKIVSEKEVPVSYTEIIQKSIYRSWLSLPAFFLAVTLSNHLPKRKDVRLASGKKQIWNNLCGKKPMKKVSEAHFQKVLKRQKSANSTKRCSNDNLKSAQTTILIER